MDMVWYGSRALLGKQVRYNRFRAKENAITALLRGRRATMQQAVLYLTSAYTSQLTPEMFSHITEEHPLYHLDLTLYIIPLVAGHRGN